ncbi:MAG: transcription-repair coupling factor [Gammaproteobacteria bacterium]|nr:transcription-repair coupling factor [Gammaproteobacteria bacterium]
MKTSAHPLITAPLPLRPRDPLYWRRPPGAALAFLLAETARRHEGPLLLITPSMQDAYRLETELGFFLDQAEVPVMVFPDTETLPYDLFSPHHDLVAQRLATLDRLPDLKRGVVVVSVPNLLTRLPPTNYVRGRTIRLARGQRLDVEAFRHRLNDAGYRLVAQVMEHGEFAVRGAILDLFPSGQDLPVRVDLFDDEIESLRLFDPETQRSIETIEVLNLLPAREYPLDKDSIQQARKAWGHYFDTSGRDLLRQLQQGLPFPGIEYYLPLFFDGLATLFDYLPAKTICLSLPGLEAAAHDFWREAQERYEQRRHDRERPLLPPEMLFISLDQLGTLLHERLQVRILAEDDPAFPQATSFQAKPLPELGWQAHADDPAQALRKFISNLQGRLLVTAESPGRREALGDLLRRHGLHFETVESWSAFLASDKRLLMTVAPLEEGLYLPSLLSRAHGARTSQGLPAGMPEGAGSPLAIVTEAQLFAERVAQRGKRVKRTRDAESIIHNLTELAEGAPVVHEDHGVGRYRGLTVLEVGGLKQEFLTLEYAGGDRIYVPVTNLHLISRYTGASPEHAPLHKLGSDAWDKAKKKAMEQTRDVAAELLDLYARRAARKGHAFQLDPEAYARFAEGFPFEETPDQLAAINAVIEDMTSGKPMDRVVCGDVGFGKTEVAMRAAFVAVQDGRQVAVLAPTTLLAQQHLRNFRDRFADFAVRIEGLSRFTAGKETRQVLEDLAAGKIDIIIGTHKLISPEVRFKNLGLVIIDEEQRFGVRHKEQLKNLRAEVDLLTMTATPIPRTLNMALSGLRELSIIATPPKERLAVKTLLTPWDTGLIREAILRELKRGGQVYFLHNEVDSIERMTRELSELIPEARIRYAHGQMPEKELEQVMADFYHHRFNVLVSTTIIESGIDIPSANTILINRADKLGLAQLHQLRGRVGRSHHRAYCYLITPPKGAMTPDAVKRLEAIEKLEDLGVGFTLATHDLEIRGAGELLGEAQSGQMNEVGFTLYMELLDRAVRALKSGKQPELMQPLRHGVEVDLRLPALLPEDYVADVHARLILYKRIASLTTEQELNEMRVELIDRFGLLPPATQNLLRQALLRIRAQKLGIRKLEAAPNGGRILFDPQPPIDPMTIVHLMQREPKTYQLGGQDALRFTAPLEDADKRFGFIERLLTELEQGLIR